MAGIFESTAQGAAAGSVVPGWGTAIGAGMGLLSGVFSYFGKEAQADAMRAQAEERARRQKLQDEQVLGKATAGAAASGVEFESGSLQTYLTEMQAEMQRQREWARAAASENAGNVDAAAGFGLATDVGGTLFGYAKDNNFWRSK